MAQKSLLRGARTLADFLEHLRVVLAPPVEGRKVLLQVEAGTGLCDEESGEVAGLVVGQIGSTKGMATFSQDARPSSLASPAPAL